jgi:hypothetical protein
MSDSNDGGQKKATVFSPRSSVRILSMGLHRASLYKVNPSPAPSRPDSPNHLSANDNNNNVDDSVDLISPLLLRSPDQSPDRSPRLSPRAHTRFSLEQLREAHKASKKLKEEERALRSPSLPVSTHLSPIISPLTSPQGSPFRPGRTKLGPPQRANTQSLLLNDLRAPPMLGENPRRASHSTLMPYTTNAMQKLKKSPLLAQRSSRRLAKATFTLLALQQAHDQDPNMRSPRSSPRVSIGKSRSEVRRSTSHVLLQKNGKDGEGKEQSMMAVAMMKENYKRVLYFNIYYNIIHDVCMFVINNYNITLVFCLLL